MSLPIKLFSNKYLNYDNKIASHENKRNQITGNRKRVKGEINSFNNKPFNILLRCTYRPSYFPKTILSILNQSFDNFKIIICYDDDNCLNYLNQYINHNKIKIFKCNEVNKTGNQFYNLYCNELLDYVEEGWILFLDDDDFYYSRNSLLKIRNEISSKNDFLIWKMETNNYIIGPKHKNDINLFTICSSNFCFYHEFKNLSRWDDMKGSDFRFVENLFKNKKDFNIKIINQALAKSQHKLKFGLNGEKEFYYDKKKFSIIMAYFNRKEQIILTLNQFQRLYAYKYNFEVVIVNDCSDENEKLSDIVNNYSFKIKYIELKDKTWINSVVPLNVAILNISHDVDIVIFQNPEIFHCGNIFEHVKNIKEDEYFVYPVFSSPSYEKNNYLKQLFKKNCDNYLNEFINKIDKRHFENKSSQGWLQHINFNNRQLNFLSAISKSNLDKVGGLCNEMKDGFWYDDDEFLLRIKKVANCISIDSNKLIGIHQRHSGGSRENMKTQKDHKLRKQNYNIMNNNIENNVIYCDPKIDLNYNIHKISNNYNKKYKPLLTYIINDEARPDRFKTCSESIKNGLKNIKIIRFNAIMGHKINYKNYITSDRKLDKYTPGQIGCILSHLSVIKNFYENINDNIILICEDDIYIDNISNLNIYQVIDNIPDDWHMLRLLYTAEKNVLNKIFKYHSNYIPNLNTEGYVCGTQAYLICKRGAKFIVDSFWDITDNKWNIDYFVKKLENKYNTDRFALDLWLYETINNYIYKFPFMNFNCNESTTSSSSKEMNWVKSCKKSLEEVITSSKLFNPEISIILPTYNRKDKIIKVIPYLLKQTFTNFELIIVIDGSIDGTYDYLINNYGNYNNIHIIYQKNKKLPAALNEGLLRCRGNYITWTSDDNFPRTNYLSEFYKFMEKNKHIDFAYSGFKFYGNNSWIENSKLNNLDIFFNYPGLASFIWRKNIINKVGFYDEDLLGIEDYDYILRTIEINPNIGYVNQVLYDYYLGDNDADTMTSNIIKNNKLKELNIRLLQKIITRNNGLPSLDFFFPHENKNNKELYKILNNYMINCKKEGYGDFFKLNNIKIKYN